MDFLDPAERVLHTSEVIFGGEGEQTVCIITIDVTHEILAFLGKFSHTGIIVRQIFFVQGVETTTETEGIFTNAKDGIMILSIKISKNQ